MKTLKVLGVLSLPCAAAIALADVPLIDLKVRAGYSWSNRFDDSFGNSVRLSGPEIGVDLPLSGIIPGVSLTFSPSILFGGALQSGSDPDGRVYRLQAMAMSSVPLTQLYGGFGVGFSFADGQDFDRFSGFSTRAVVGYRLNAGPSPVSPAIEVSYHTSSRGALSGWTIGLSLGL